MQFSYNTLLVVALGLESTLAQPANRQKQRRDLADVNWSTVQYDVNWSTVNYNGAPVTNAPSATTTPVAAVAAPATTTTVVAQPASPKKGGHHHHHEHKPKPKPVVVDDSSASSSSPSHSSKSFGAKTEPKDDGDKDHYIGNVGNPYGSNMILLEDPEHATGYKYSNTFTNPTSDKITVIVWNKSGKDGQAQSGMGSAPTLTFSLEHGESKAVAFDENSQVAFSQDCTRSTISNIPDCTWGELDFGDIRNGGWSGYDRSSIPNSAGNTGLLTIKCEGAKTSGKGNNDFVSEAQSNAGGALAPGPAHFFTTMGA